VSKTRGVLPLPVAPKRPSRHPFEVGVLLGVAGSAFSQLMAGATPLSVNSHLTDQIQVLLSTCTLVGSLICLLGIAWPEPLTSRMLEIAGLVGLAGALGIYSYQYITTITTWTSSTGIGITLGLFAACLIRIVQASTWIIGIYRKAS
jgi:hypothetical protein